MPVDTKADATIDAASSYSTLAKNGVVAGHETYVMKYKTWSAECSRGYTYLSTMQSVVCLTHITM